MWSRKEVANASEYAVGVLAEDLHLALVALAHAVALEPVLVPALLLAHLAVPPQLLQPFRLDSVRFGFGFGVRNSFFPV